MHSYSRSVHSRSPCPLSFFIPYTLSIVFHLICLDTSPATFLDRLRGSNKTRGIYVTECKNANGIIKSD